MVRISDRSRDAVESDDGVDLPQLWATVLERRGFVLAVGTVLFLVVMVYSFTSPMSFRSSGRLYLGELEVRALSATGSAAQVDISGAGQGDIGSEIEILKSQSLVTRAIMDSGLNVNIAPEGWRPPRMWQWLVGGRMQRMLDVPARELRVVETALADDALGPRSYVIVFDSPTQYRVLGDADLPLASGVLGKPTQVQGLSGLTLLPGREGTPIAGARFGLSVQPLDAVTDGILGSLTVSAPSTAASGDGAKVVMLEFTHSSPNAAATFLRELMRGYLGERQTWKTEDASAAETFVGEQLGSLRNALEVTQKRLADYRSNTRVVVHENGANTLIEQVGKYEEQRVQARLQVAALLDMKRALKQPHPPTEAFLFGEAQDTVLEGLSTTLTSARREQESVNQQFGAASAQGQQAASRVDAQLATIRNYVHNRLARAQESLAELDRIIRQFDDKLKTVPGAELGLAQLGRESEVYSRVYSYMLERQQQAAILKASTVSKNRILDYPKIPYREDAPKLGARAASLLLGLLLGAVLAILHRLFASSLQSEAEVRRTVGGLPIFATIPRREDAAVRPGERRVDPFREPYSRAYAEAFRTVRANIYQEVQSDVGKVVLITSPAPGDGKTSSVFALARTLAADERRVCVIDADLRKPSHHEIVEHPSIQGLREVLAGLSRWTDVVSTVVWPGGQLDSIAAGQKGPAEPLSGARMNRLISELRSRYDYIILDCASFPVVADSLVLAPLSDCVLSVFRLRNTPHKAAAEHVRKLSAASMTYGVLVQDSNRVGLAYPMRAAPGLLVAAQEQFRAVRQRGGLRELRLSSWISVALLIAAVSGAAAVVSRSKVPPPRPISPLPVAAAAAPSSPVPPASGLLLVDPMNVPVPVDGAPGAAPGAAPPGQPSAGGDEALKALHRSLTRARLPVAPRSGTPSTSESRPQNGAATVGAPQAPAGQRNAETIEVPANPY